MAIKTLKSSYDLLDDIEQHFKLEAGPGSGKTTFIALHIKRILFESKRLNKTRKVACITYTNVGVESLNERLGDAKHDVEVSTIHSFLYEHILKPYFWLLEDWPFDVKDFPKLYKQRLNGNHLFDVLKSSNDFYLISKHKVQLSKIRKAFDSLKWIKNNEEYEFTIYPFYNRNIQIDEKDSKNRPMERKISNRGINEYRNKCHEEGILLYEDIIYYSYLLLNENPNLCDVIRAKFPYLFIDEFQDTTSLQTDILKLLGKKEMIIGVIGDGSQSIYEFNGAKIKDFNRWSLDKMQQYYLGQNRRSHSAIVDVLNYFTNNERLKQTSIRCKIGDNRPLIILDSLKNAVKYSKEYWEGNLKVLGYNFDKTVEYYNPELQKDVFKKFTPFLSKDSVRGRLIRGTLKIIEALKALDYPIALEEVKKIQKRDSQVDEKSAMEYLERIRTTFSNYQDKPISDFYNEVLYPAELVTASALTNKGNPAKKYEITLRNALSVITKENKKYKEIQTIHSMKGDEANNILVAIPHNDIRFLTEPDLSLEVHRIYFVAASRAKENLAFQIEVEHPEDIAKHINSKLFKVVKH